MSRWIERILGDFLLAVVDSRTVFGDETWVGASFVSGESGWASAGTGWRSRQVPVERMLDEMLGRREFSDIVV
jgi:hypothetical protein